MLAVSLAAIAAIITVAVIAVFAPMANAADKIADGVEAYLKENNINYSEVSVKGNRMSVGLISEGDGRHTLEDIKAIEAIYEAVHAQKVVGKISAVEITVKDAEGNLLSSDTVNMSDSVASEKSDDAIIKDIKVLADGLLGSEYTVEIAKYSDDELRNVIVRVNGDADSTSAADSLYRALKNYRALTGAIDKCEIYVEDESGKCLYYVTGELEYGNMLAWVSEQAEEAFVGSHGPAPADE